MSCSQMIELLKEKNKGKIVIIKLGAFYIATGEDAVLLNKELKLKCICFKNNICKVGIPINSIEKYLKNIEKLNYAYIVYDFDKAKTLLIEKYNFLGKENKEKEKNTNCLICKGVSYYKDEDKYMVAMRKLYE